MTLFLEIMICMYFLITFPYYIKCHQASLFKTNHILQEVTTTLEETVSSFSLTQSTNFNTKSK